MQAFFICSFFELLNSKIQLAHLHQNDHLTSVCSCKGGLFSVGLYCGVICPQDPRSSSTHAPSLVANLFVRIHTRALLVASTCFLASGCLRKKIPSLYAQLAKPASIVVGVELSLVVSNYYPRYAILATHGFA